MAILNNKGLYVSYECPELIEDVKRDCHEFNKRKFVYAACKKKAGVKIVFDYVYDIYDKEQMKNFPPLKENEWFEKTTLGKLLAYVTRQNNATNEYSNINELFDATGMTIKEFSDHFGIPYRTVQDWILGNRPIADYLFNLLQYYLIHEKII